MSGQEPDIEKRLLLAIVLSMVILLGAQFFFQEPQQPPAPTPTPPEAAASPQPAEATSPAEAMPVPATTTAAALPEPGEPPSERRGEARQIVVENDVLRLMFDTRGAVLSSIQLKGFNSPAGAPVELLPPAAPRQLGRPLQVSLGDEFLDGIVAGEPYLVSGADGEQLTAPASLTFEVATGGVAVTKVVQVPESGYELTVSTQVTREGRDAPHRLLLGPGLGPGSGLENDFLYPAAVFRSAGETTHVYDSDLSEERQVFETPADWVGADSKYFSLLLVSDSLAGLDADLAQWADAEGTELSVPRVRARLQGAGQHRLFVGPKLPQVLAETDPSLRSVIDLGWFALLVEPLLLGLRFFYAGVHNWGLAIILLTFAINLALFPLRYKQITSMSKMTALQPQLKSIQDRYKRMKRDDPRRQQMNAEVMALYKEHGVNPLGGCLPLVFQMPILIAFYRMLDQAIELRGAPFMLWIQDLSQPDPYFVTPLLMGVTMVLQQKMTPSTADPAQKRMMMFLPVFFTFLFLWVSSGLALYFLFSNLFAMMFQFLLQAWNPELVAGPAKAAGRKKKRSRGSA